MAEIIQVTDLPTALQGAELVTVMVAGANAKASRVAPCLTWDGSEESEPEPSEAQLAEAKLVLIGAVKRWHESGSGAVQQQTAGPFGVSVDTRQQSRGYNLWPSEIVELQAICKSDDDSPGVFAVDTVADGGWHSPICSLYFGATDCSCGADIAGFAIYEVP